MKLNTLRNVMLSMLVLGVAGSVVGMGSGTFAVFNATTTSTGNTFSTASITFSNTTTAGVCTSTAGGTAGGNCTSTLTRSSMVAGDSQLGTTTLTNGGNAGVTVSAAITDSGSNSISTTAIGAPGTSTAVDALGLLVFECLDSGGADIACNSASVSKLYTVYGSCGTSSGTAAAFATVTQSGAFSASHVTTSGVTDNGIKIGTASDGVCYGGNAAIKGLTVPIVASSSSPTVAGGNSLAATKTDNLAIIVYLPTTADNSAQNQTSTSYTLTYTATQLAGSST